MKKRTLIGIYFVSVIGSAILGSILSILFLEHFSGSEFPFPIPVEYLPSIRFLLGLKTVISFVNMSLILLMLGIYVDLYRKIKTNFTAGLLLLIIVLLLNAFTSNPLLFLSFEGGVISPSMRFIIPDALTTIALTVLFYLSLE